MKKAFLLFLLSTSLLQCRKPSTDGGIIVNEVDLGVLCDFPKEEYVISDSATYAQLQLESNCSNPIFPYIDFNEYTLLGKFASGKCKVKFYREVLKNDPAKTYDYTVYVRDKGWCKAQGQSMNWVLVPKLPQGYSVSFFIDKK